MKKDLKMQIILSLILGGVILIGYILLSILKFIFNSMSLPLLMITIVTLIAIVLLKSI